MSDTVLIGLIIGVVVAGIVFALRGKLSKFGFKAKGIDASVETHNRASVNITGNVQDGRKHVIRTGRSDVNISDNLQEGEKNIIDTEPADKSE